jgi:diguanylate cyclase (GGDEF)-like protein/PAS domain S-box-containing protein
MAVAAGQWGGTAMVVPGCHRSGEPPAGARWPRSPAPTVILAALAVASAVPSRPGAGPLTPGALLGLLAALAVAGSPRLRLRLRDEVWSLELFESVLLVAVYALPGRLAVALAALAASLAQGSRRAPLASAAFSVARWSCAAGAGSLVFAALRDGASLRPRNLLALLAAALAVALAGRLPALLACWWAHPGGPGGGRPPARAPLRLRALGVAVELAFGALLLTIWAWAPLVIPLLLVPLELGWWAARAAAAVRAGQARTGGVQRAAHALGVPVDPREAIPPFLTAVRHCFKATAAELVVVESRQRVVWRSRDGVPAAARRAEPAEWETLAAVLVNLEVAVWLRSTDPDASMAALLRRDGWRDCLAAPVRSGGRVAGVLVVFDPDAPRGSAPAELAALETLAGEAGAALDRAALLDAILEERAKLAEIVEHTSGGIATLDPDGTVSSWNPGFQQITGYRAEDVAGTRGLARLRPRDPAGREVRLERWAQEARPFPSILEVLTLTGGRCWLSCSYTRVPDGDGRPRRLVLTARDVTAEHELERAEQELRRSAARFRALVQNSSHMVVVLDVAGGVTYASPAFWRMLGHRDKGQTGQSLFDLVHPDDAQALRRGFGEHLAGTPQSAGLEFRCLAADGTWRHLEALASNLLDDPAVAGVVLNTRDLTERKRAEGLLAAQAHVLGLIARDAPLMATLSAVARLVETEAGAARCAVLLLDEDGETLTVAAAPSLVDTGLHEADGLVVRPLAGSSGTAVHRQLPVLVSDVASDPLWAETRRAALARGLRAAWAMPVTTAESRRVLGTVTVYFDRPRTAGRSDIRLLEAAAGLAGIAIERSQAQTRLAHQAAHDALTGLPNRVFFLDRAAHALARTRRSRSSVAVLFCDLDRFKVINDSLGHEAGDKLLRELARRLQEVVRPGDTVARFGGDEFTILCESIADEAHALAIAERVGHVAATPFALGDAEVLVTMSVGIALGSGARTSPEALIENADAAMYRAKARGGNRREVFDRDMRARSKRRLALQSALHRAVERGEFRVFYQPVVCLRSRLPVGAEALVRWQHPERGLVGPDEFIGLAEETGLIVPIGAQVLREACRQVERWRVAGAGRQPLCIKVNLSARQFAHPSLVEVVAGILAETGVDPARVYLEITESVLMDDAESTGAALSELKSLGVSLAVDDFGTGYSSLLYLKRFPVDELKVDRTFVAGLLGNAEDRAIVAAVVNLAHTLGLKAVAEGVESTGQLARLQELGCDMGQGYHFGRPMPAESMALHLGLEPSSA